MTILSPSRVLASPPAQAQPAFPRRLALAWAVVIAGVTSILLTNDRSTMISQLVGNVGFMVALAFGAFYTLRAARRRTPFRRAWATTSVAFIFGTLGQLSYVLQAVSGGESAPSPVVDAVVFFGYVVPFFAALFFLPRRSDRMISRFRQILDVVVITTGTVLISEATVLSSVREAIDLTTVAGLVRFSYPISDLALCAATLCLGMRHLPGDRLIWLLYGGGLVMLAVTDSIYVRLLSEGQTMLTATPLSTGWMLVPVLMGLATVAPRREGADPSGETSLAVQLVPYVPVLGAIFVLVPGRRLEDPLILFFGIVLLLAVTVRQVMIVYENVVLTRDLEARVAARTDELARLGSIVTSSNQAIVGVSLDSTVTAWNPAAEQLFGYRAEDVLGRSPTFLSNQGMEGVQTLLARAAAGQSMSPVEVEWERPNGERVPVALMVSPIADETGVQGISVTGQDITERRRAAAALEQAREEALESSRLKSEFLATMSHEIRTPMNGVIGLTSLLLETELDGRQRQYAEGVQGAGEALLSVINDILDFSKLEAGKVVLDPTSFDPRRLVDEVGALLAPAAASKGLELITYCLPEVPSAVHGDPGRIRQILLNLASNAVKFTPEGEVAVRGRSYPTDDGGVLLRFDVTDTGIGIAEKDQRRLFESFSQADASTTRRFGGTGLGLAISRRLVEVMGGDIGLESSVGVGSRFWFEIPLLLGTAVEGPVSPELRPDLLNGLRVLVVDDNATNRTILEEQLRSWRMAPDVAANAAVALERLRASAADGRPYDLATLDMLMPELDGLQLAELITEDPLLQGMPLIMLTSSPSLRPEVLGTAGVAEWLPKPVRSSELYDRLVRLMAPREAELAARTSPVTRPPAEPGGRGDILVVEDNTLNQLVAEGIVNRLGFGVRSVDDGLQAIEALETGTYCAVLMDCHMPKMDGFEATREIRRREHGQGRIPIIAMTAGALPEDREECLAAGMDAYVSKPIDLDALERVLDDLARSPFDPLDRGVMDMLEAEVAQPAERPPPVTVPAELAIDESRLEVLRRLETPDGSSMFRVLVSAFVARSADRLVAVRVAAGQAKADDLAGVVHELKGAAGTIGAVRVEQVCQELELRARAGTAVPDDLLDQLGAAIDQANDALLTLADHRS